MRFPEAPCRLNIPPESTVIVSASSIVIVVPPVLQDKVPPSWTVIPPLNVVSPPRESVPSCIVKAPATVRVPDVVAVFENLFTVNAPVGNLSAVRVMA